MGIKGIEKGSLSKLSLSKNFDDLAKRIEEIKVRSEVDEIIGVTGPSQRTYATTLNKVLPCELIAKSGVPDGFITSTFNCDLLPEDSKSQYVASLNKLIAVTSKPCVCAMVGTRGPGKTHMGCALVLDFCNKGKSAYFCEALDYLGKLQGSYRADSTKGQEKIETEFIRHDLLVLDEMQERGETFWEDRMLTRLVNKRYANDKITVLISNQTKELFIERIGPSIADRMNEGGGIIVCNWNSLRGRIKETP